MNILVINYEYPPIGGGGGFVTRDILEHMVTQGHDVEIITSQFNDLPVWEIHNGVKIRRVPVLGRNKTEVASMQSMLSYFPSSIFSVLTNIRKNDYEVINTHFAIPSGPSGSLLSKIYNIPNVLTIHGGDIYDPSKPLSPHKTPLLKNVVRFILYDADRVVAQSTDTLSNAVMHYKTRRKIDIIPLGIKKPDFKKKKREDFGFKKNELILCTIGRLVKRKNIDDMLSVVSTLKKDLFYKLIIIGDGPEYNHIQLQIKKLGLSENVKMVGNVSDETKFQLLDLADIYLSSAMHEGFGLVFLEAMECGCPIVSFNKGGQNDFLSDGLTGFLVDLGNKIKFGQRIFELARNKNLREMMGLKNQELVKNYYISECANSYISLFEKTIEFNLRKRQ